MLMCCDGRRGRKNDGTDCDCGNKLVDTENKTHHSSVIPFDLGASFCCRVIALVKNTTTSVDCLLGLNFRMI